MSRHVPLPAAWRDAVCDSGLDRTAKLVGLVISTYMNGSSLKAWPSRKTIAKDASLGDGCRSVDQALERLEAAGLLRIERSKGRSSHRYFGTFPTSHPDATFSEPNVASDDAQRRISRRPTSHPGATESAESAKKAGNDAATPDGASSLPEGECHGCGECRPLVDERALYCADCLSSREAE